MKKLSVKITAVLAVLILLTAVLAPTAYALGGFDIGSFSELLGDNFDFGSITDILGGLLGGGNGQGVSLSDLLSNPNMMEYIQTQLETNWDITASRADIINAVYALLEDVDLSDVSSLSSLLSSNEFIAKLAEYLRANQTTEPLTTEPTTEPTTEATTENSTTEPSSYEVPTVIIPSTYVYQGADVYTTMPPVTSTEPVYSYVQPATQYTDPATTVPFTPNYTESTREASNNSAKLMIGAVVVLASVGAIVVVAMMLKKTKA